MRKHARTTVKTGILAAALLLASGAGFGQDPQNPPSEKPKPAAKAYGPIGAEDQDPNQTPADTLQPDDRPLTGFQQPTVGIPMERHSYWVPGVSYYNFIQSNGFSQGGGDSWNSTSYLAGNISLLQNWSRAQLTLNYSGGGNFSTDSSVGNGWFQQLGATQTFLWERWQLTLLDEFAYLPQSQFGFGSGTGLALPGVGGTLGGGTTGLGGQFNPGQSIFTAIGPRYTNTFGTQLNYVLSKRSSITFGGLFSIERFVDAGNIESDDYTGNIGYNYQITRADTIGILYRYSSIHYLGLPQAIGDYSIQAAYGRKITGRLALQLTGGPEITHQRVPQGTNTQQQFVAGTGSATISYAFEKGNISANYFHGVTTGSGVFLGATTDQVTGSLSRKLSRVWSGNASLGFARNRSLVTGQSGSGRNYDTFYGGASVARPLGRNANFSLGYTAYLERAGSGICGGASCASDFTTNEISIGLSWHTRPFVLH
jgi:hypothetical protein